MWSFKKQPIGTINPIVEAAENQDYNRVQKCLPIARKLATKVLHLILKGDPPVELVEQLAQVADLNTLVDGKTVIHRKKHLGTLIRNGADPNALDGNGRGLIHMGYLKILEHGGDIDLVSSKGQTALHIACQMGFVTKNYLEHGADPNLPDSDNKTPWQIYLTKQRIDMGVLEDFINHGADLSCLNGNVMSDMICRSRSIYFPDYQVTNPGERKHMLFLEMFKFSDEKISDKCQRIMYKDMHLAMLDGVEAVEVALKNSDPNIVIIIKNSNGWMAYSPLMVSPSYEISRALINAGGLKSGKGFYNLTTKIPQTWKWIDMCHEYGARIYPNPAYVHFSRKMIRAYYLEGHDLDFDIDHPRPRCTIQEIQQIKRSVQWTKLYINLKALIQQNRASGGSPFATRLISLPTHLWSRVNGFV